MSVELRLLLIVISSYSIEFTYTYNVYRKIFDGIDSYIFVGFAFENSSCS